MENKTRQREKDKELIQQIKKKDKSAQTEFFQRCKPLATHIVKDFLSNDISAGRADVEDIEDTTQDILVKAFDKIMSSYKIKESLEGWIRTFSRNYCIDKYRKDWDKKKLKPLNHYYGFNQYTAITEHIKDERSIAPGSKDYHGLSRYSAIKHAYKRDISLSTRESIALSLEYVEEFYEAKRNIKHSYLKISPDYRVRNILLQTQKRLRDELGQDIENEISRHNELSARDKQSLSNSEKRELKKLKSDSHRFKYVIKINELIRRAQKVTSSYARLRLGRIDGVLPLSDTDLHSDIFKFKIEPGRFMYELWSRVKELRRGQYVDLKKISLIFAYHKLISKGITRRSFFAEIGDDLSNLKPYINNLRQYKYRKSKNAFYKKLVRYFYKRSFVDKVSIYKPLHLSLIGLKEGWITGDSLDDTLMRLPESEIPQCLMKRKRQLMKSKSN